jgi:tellurite resistance protein TerC
MFGLRSLYFVVSDALDRLSYLRPGLATVLLFTATKMILNEWIHLSPAISVSIIVLVLARNDRRVTVAAGVLALPRPTGR